LELQNISKLWNNNEEMNNCKFFLTCIILFFITINFIWIKIDKAPPMWDQSHYLLNSEILYHTLTSKGLYAFSRAFIDILQAKAPLITVLPIPFFLIFGNSYDSALYINLLLVILCSYYLYKLGAIIIGERQALLSIIILNTFPLIAGMSREILVEYGLMVLVISWFYYFVKSDYFQIKKYSYLLGIIFGLGMLMKITFPLYITFPTAFILFRKIISEKRELKKILKYIFTIFFISVILAGPWYSRNYEHIIQFAYTASFGDLAMKYWTGNIFSVQVISDYWLSLINYGISSYYFILSIIIIIIITFSKIIKRKSFLQIEKEYIFILLLWFLVPFILLTFGKGKDYRYIAPICPPIALILSTLFYRTSIKRIWNTLLMLLLIFPIIHYFCFSFLLKNFNIKWEEMIFISNHLNYAHPPELKNWAESNEKLINYLLLDSAKLQNNYALSTVLFNYPYINFITSTYYARKNGSGLNFNTNDFYNNETTKDIIERIKQTSTYIITKSGDLGPDFSNIKNVQIIPLLENRTLNFNPINKIQLPDDTFLTIYKKEIDKELIYNNKNLLKKYPNAYKKQVIFSEIIKLVYYEIKEIPSGYKLTFFWECINLTSLNFKVFIHFKSDEMNKHDIANADHYPNREYPTFLWRKGEIIKDVINISANLPKNLKIYIGLYDELDLSRLPVANKPVNSSENIIGVRIL
jgi:4-amino-4-deoxy-L-arabinose transferase-like glycosyltransferase